MRYKKTMAAALLTAGVAAGGMSIEAATASAATPTHQEIRHDSPIAKPQPHKVTHRDQKSVRRPNLKPFRYQNHQVKPVWRPTIHQWGFWLGNQWIRIVL